MGERVAVHRPDVDDDPLAECRLKAGGSAGVEQLLEPRGSAAVELAEDQLVHRRVADHAGLRDYC